MTIGQRILELRKLNGLSQEELGNRVGVQRAAINKYEKGTVTNIPIQTIENMAVVFDVSPSYIVGWDSPGGNDLAMEVKIVQGVDHFFGKDAVELLEAFTELNQVGKKKSLEYVQDLGRISRYRQDLT